MRVGYGRVEFAVPDGTPMGGYLDRSGPSTGRLDPLQVGAITWFDGERRFALATADVVCVNEDLGRRARQLTKCELWLAASHTHAGPETGCVPGGGPTPEPWLDRIAEATRAAVRQAIDNEQPCAGMVHHGELRGVGADRSRPSAEAVVPLDLVAVRTDGPAVRPTGLAARAGEPGVRAGEPAVRTDGLAGVLVVLPVHPTVLPAANRQTSADLVGAVRRSLRERLGGDVWVVVATGAAGDISTRHTRRGQDTAELDRLGGVVADRCAELLTEPATRGWSAGSRISSAERRLTLRPASVAADPAALTADYEAALAAGDPVATRLARSRLEGVRARSGLAGGRAHSGQEDERWTESGRARNGPDGMTAPNAPPAPIGVTVHTTRLGGLAMVGLPGEPFLAVAESLRAPDHREPVVVLGYVNGYPGYLPTIDAYRRTEYEVLASPVAPGSAELLAETARHLLEGS
ncbi:hypothetical protein AB0H88_21680 [Nonomuraea sp. NPDC050680]|uniref:hypothetical protein n=1 Tax=Nonomuraea sp. NPDC050680 TaxID=3154630 RepID=UPI0033DAA064